MERRAGLGASFAVPATVGAALLLTELVEASALLRAVQVLLVLGLGVGGVLVTRAVTAGQRRAHAELVAEGARRAEAEEALRRREAFLSGLVDVLGVEVVAVDPAGRPLLWNEASRRAYGVRDEADAGAPEDWAERFVLLDRDGAPLRSEDLPLRRALAGERVEGAEVTVAPPGRPLRRLLVHARPLRLPDGELLGAVSAGHDVTALRHREDELRRLNADLDAVAHAKDAVLTGSDAREAVCVAAVEITGALSVLLLEVTDDGRCLRTTRSSGLELPPLELPVDSGSLASLALRTGEVQVAADVRADPVVNQAVVGMFDALTGAPLLQAAVHVPLLHEGRARGVLSVALPARLGAGDARLLGLLELLAADAVGAIAREDLVRQLASQALTDALTGLPNRRAWDDDLAREVARAGRAGGTLTVAVLDLDHFKHFNDAHGHPAGDRLLADVAALWSARVRAGDVVARLGGEEFGVLLPDCRTADAVPLVARLLDGLPGGATCSAGVASLREGDDAAALLAAADRALYRAKESGRARLVVADPAPQQRTPV